MKSNVSALLQQRNVSLCLSVKKNVMKIASLIWIIETATRCYCYNSRDWRKSRTGQLIRTVVQLYAGTLIRRNARADKPAANQYFIRNLSLALARSHNAHSLICMCIWAWIHVYMYVHEFNDGTDRRWVRDTRLPYHRGISCDKSIRKVRDFFPDGYYRSIIGCCEINELKIEEVSSI